MMRVALTLFILASALSAQETANIARLHRQCVVSPRLRSDVASYRIAWGTVRFERFARLGGNDYYTQLCYPKEWMGKPSDSARRTAALYAGVWRVPKGKKLATLEHFVFQDQGQVRPPRRLETPVGSVWYLPAPCICASKVHLDSYFLIKDQKLHRLDTDSWERDLRLPDGTTRGATPQVDLVAMEGHLPLSPSGKLQAKLRLNGTKLAVEKTQILPR